jgi:hypothetical protein
MLGMYQLDSYPWWFVANALVTGLLLGVGVVALYARLTGGGGDEPEAG